MKSASIRRSVVFPVPVPPLISSVFAAADLFGQELCKWARKRAASDQIFDGVNGGLVNLRMTTAGSGTQRPAG